MTVAASATRPSWGWLTLSSLWMIPVLGTIGMLSWVGFLIVGITDRRRMWVWFGVGYLGLAAVLVFGEWDEWRGTLGLLLWAGTVIHALIINPQHLRLRWIARAAGGSTRVPGRGSRAAGRGSRTIAPRTPSRARHTDTAAATLLDAPGTDARDYLAAPTTATTATTQPRTRTEPNEVDPVDVNEASRRALERLPGMNRRRAARAVKEREARGGFSSADEFCRVLELQPHEIVRLRAAIFCSPKIRTVRGVGRKLDL